MGSMASSLCSAAQQRRGRLSRRRGAIAIIECAVQALSHQVMMMPYRLSTHLAGAQVMGATGVVVRSPLSNDLANSRGWGAGRLRAHRSKSAHCLAQREKQDLTDGTRAFIEANARTSRCCHSGYAAGEP
jgi:hypothetical protein